MNRQPPRLRAQRGVATLVVVMVLLFVVTMVAAYASRNMIFEQRTGANYYRSTQAFEVAEAGVQWAQAMLNSGRVDDACVASTDASDPTFRQRYLNVDPTTGVITATQFTPASGPVEPLSPTCVFDPDSGNWTCSCPRDSAPSLTAPGAGTVAPAFRLRFVAGASRPGAIIAEVIACTRLDDSCLSTGSLGTALEGRAVVRVMLYHGGRSMSLPLASLTVRGTVDANGLTISNSHFGDSGITVHASGDVLNIGVPGGLSLNTLAGNALSGDGTTLRLDGSLNPPDLPGSAPATGSDRFFASVFNMSPATAKRQPAVVMLGDCGGSCSDSDLADAVRDHPGRPIWVSGNLGIASGVSIGSDTEPVVLIVDGGDLTITAAGAVINGLVVVRPAAGAAWNVPAMGRIRGAVVVDGGLVGPSGGFEIEYDGAMLRAAQARSGSYVPVTGSWRDSRPNP